MQKFKIIKIETKKAQLKWFSAWIKNDLNAFGYANGYVIVHKSLNIQEALNDDLFKSKLPQEVALNERADVLAKREKWSFLNQIMQTYKADISEFYIVGFDTTKASSYKGHYRKHNVESALRHFGTTLTTLNLPKEILKSKIENVEKALNELKETLKNY